MPYAYDVCKPTLVFIDNFITKFDLFKEQFVNERLSNAINLIVIEPLGHEQTRTKSLYFIYWDTSIMKLQVIDAQYQGQDLCPWYFPRRLDVSANGITRTQERQRYRRLCARKRRLSQTDHPISDYRRHPLGTSVDYERERSRRLGCWDAISMTTSFIE